MRTERRLQRPSRESRGAYPAGSCPLVQDLRGFRRFQPTLPTFLTFGRFFAVFSRRSSLEANFSMVAALERQEGLESSTLYRREKLASYNRELGSVALMRELKALKAEDAEEIGNYVDQFLDAAQEALEENDQQDTFWYDYFGAFREGVNNYGQDRRGNRRN